MHKLKTRRLCGLSILTFLGIIIALTVDEAPIHYVGMGAFAFLMITIGVVLNEVDIINYQAKLDRLDPSTWGEPDTGHHSGLRRR